LAARIHFMTTVTRPLVIYDGECGFCKRWVERWRLGTGEAVDYASFQDVRSKHPEIGDASYQTAIHLIMPDGKILKGAEAVYETLAHIPGKRGWRWAYRRVPGFKFLAEWAYAFVAKHRVLFSRLTQLLWGNEAAPTTQFVVRNVFLRLLGVIYALAFVSMAVQITGLVGAGGILPAQTFLETVHDRLGVSAYWIGPTIFWLNASDVFLTFICWLGVAVALCVGAGFIQSPLLFILWGLYLSILTVGREFLSFQWDILLLEAGFLAIFFAPLDWRRRAVWESAPSNIVLWLLRWLSFRVIFSSGVVKLASQDETWRSLTALNFHYETQPLPPWIAWHMHQLPEWFQKLSVAGMFGVELLLPLLIFTPRRLRALAFWGLVSFQILIIVTGNYGYFNWLTIVLCICLLDDQQLPWKRRAAQVPVKAPLEVREKFLGWSRWILVPIALLLVIFSLGRVSNAFGWRFRFPPPLFQIQRLVYPYHLVNRYGLFAVMTTSRPEIIVEGSRDGTEWLPYEFKYKAGGLARRPRFVAPHMPRLDWQMWFAALSDYRGNPWFINFCIRLLEGSPEVSALLARNPFPDEPPVYIRAVKYDYHFTDAEERAADGTWWKREKLGLYLPVLSLRER